MNFGWGSGRCCYLRSRTLPELYRDPLILNALVDELWVPGKAATLKRLSAEEKQAAIEEQIENFRKSRLSVWRDVEPPEVLAGAIWRVLSAGHRRRFFFGVGSESALLRPVAGWLASKGCQPYKEVPLGRARIDVLGYSKGGFLNSERLVAVELKNEPAQFGRALDQLSTVSEYVNEVYLACTPAFAMNYLDKNANARGTRHWDSSVLDRKLGSLGIGLLLVEGNEVDEVLRPRQGYPNDSRRCIAIQGLSERLKVKC